ncbi:hypothetical protein HK103_005243 [Boothiomyces macroporosus]|uniref:Arsenate reductase n=1 Tax=Boothiomyces macroporosus TaxID=261099 RepID=A0AAD5UID7_9FUNG|nr:hypothetical protein HK103_005243 [Boothiomyces macroporosus]
MRFLFLQKPTCSKCKTILAFLTEKIPNQFETIDYTTTQLKKEKILEVISLMDKEDLDLVVRRDDFKGQVPTELNALAELLQDPLIMQRPILVDYEKKKAVVGRPLERIYDMFK